MADRRRRRWIAADVDYYATPLADAIRDRFGVIGLTVFDAFLRACKKNSVEGQISYTCVADFLGIVGLPGLQLVNEEGVEWDLEDLWRLLGDHKQTLRRRRGRVTQILSRRWEQWQNTTVRARGESQTRRSAATNTDALADESEPVSSPDLDLDLDSDNDSDSDRKTAPPSDDTFALVPFEGAPTSSGAEVVNLPARSNGRKPDLLWDSVMDACGVDCASIPPSARGGYNKAVSELRSVGAAPSDVHERAGNYRMHMPHATLTPNALARHWALCANPPPAQIRGADVLTRFVQEGS